MLGIAIGVHEHDRDGLDAVGERGLELGAHGGEIGLLLDRAVGAHALVDLDDALEQHLGLDDVLGEDFRAVLVADAQRVAETFRRHQQRAVALALQQRIGGDRRAHLHGADAAGRDRLALLQAEQVADALHGGVAIGFRVLREQLVRGQRAVRPPPDHVGEGAAAVDPEVPGACIRALVPLTAPRSSCQAETMPARFIKSNRDIGLHSISAYHASSRATCTAISATFARRTVRRGRPAHHGVEPRQLHARLHRPQSAERGDIVEDRRRNHRDADAVQRHAHDGRERGAGVDRHRQTGARKHLAQPI